MLLIVLNTISMSIKWYGWEHDKTLKKVNNIFLLFYFIEAVMKIVAYGWKYFTKKWNLFAFIVMSAGLTAFMMKTYNPHLLPKSFEIVFRAIKLFSLIKLIKVNRPL